MDIKPGQVVYSKVGRDKGRYFVITGIIDESYVYIADGDLRRIEKPKKKKLKHIVLTGEVLEPIYEKISSKRKISNADIKECLSGFSDTGK